MLLATCALSATAAASTVTLYSQSFNAGSMAADWSTGPSDFVWHYGSSESNLVGDGGCAYSTLSGLLGIEMKADLYSPVISLSGVDNAYLKFNSMENCGLIGRAYLQVYMKVDNGAYEKIWEGSQYDFRTTVVQLPATAMGHNVQFCFTHKNFVLNLLFYDVSQIDDVSVFTTNTAGQVQFDPATYAVGEDDGNAVLTVTRTNGAGAASVHYKTHDGTAKAGTNFVSQDGTINFAADQMSATVSIPVKDDGLGNSDTAFTVELYNPSLTLALGSPVTATVNVKDGFNFKKMDYVAFSSVNYTAYNTSPSVTLTIVRSKDWAGTEPGSNGWSGTISVRCRYGDLTALDGTDYFSNTAMVTFGPGETSKTITVPLNPPSGSTAQDPKSFLVMLDPPTTTPADPLGATTGSQWWTMVTIGGYNPGGVLQFSKPFYNVSETDPSVTLTVTRGVGTSGKVWVDFATQDGTAKAGTNYEAMQGTIFFDNGQPSQIITIPIKNDTIANNGDKDFTVKLSNARGADLGANPTAKVNVLDINSPYREIPYTIDLIAGWNLISFPVVNTTLWASDLKGTGVKIVAAYNETTGDYDAFSMVSSPMEYDIHMSTDIGYFVYCNAPTSITIFGTKPLGRSIAIDHGWNLVGWSSFNKSMASVVCNETSLAGKQIVAKYNPATGDYDAFSEGSSPAEYDFMMHDGVGYFVYSLPSNQETLYFEVI